MIRSERLIDKLVASLHFHGYFHLMSSDAYGNGPLNLVVSESQKKIIQLYIDDLFIDLFFRTHKFKPIITPEGWNILRYTKEGIQHTTGEQVLNLNDPFDRCTFIDCITTSFGAKLMEQLFPNNSFLKDICIKTRKYGPIEENSFLCFKKPHSDEFEQYLTYLYGANHFKYDPLYRAQGLFDYSDLYKSVLYRHCNEDIASLYDRRSIIQRQWDYWKIKDKKIFGEYSIEEILLIYCLLVDKLKMSHGYHYNRPPSDRWMFILTFIALYVYDSKDKDCFLNEFRKFESENRKEECIEPYIRDKDLFLRFTSPTNSKAIKFKYLNDSIVEIRFFNEKPVQTVYKVNTLPLPFLYYEINNPQIK